MCIFTLYNKKYKVIKNKNDIFKTVNSILEYYQADHDYASKEGNC